MDSPRILKTHCIPRWLPREIRTDDPKAKVIYIARNPKDAAVSYYHFCHYFPGLPLYENWDAFFEEFIANRGRQKTGRLRVRLCLTFEAKISVFKHG